MSEMEGRGDLEREALRAYDADDEAGLRAALEAGASAEARAGDGSRLLAVAARRGRLEMAKILLAFGANPNADSPDELAPLSWAVLDGGRELTAALLEAGADPSAMDRMGGTALMRAASGIRFGDGAWAIKALLEAGADPDARNERGESALGVAARSGRLREMEALIKGGADVGAGDKSEGSPWGQAKAGGREEAMRLLLASWEAEELKATLGGEAEPRGGSRRL